LVRICRDKFCQHLWHVHFGEPMDRRPHDYHGVRAEVRSRYFKWEWNEVYDFIEFVARYHPDDYQGGFAKECNRVLEKELSAYRFAKEILVPITSDQELRAVQKALELTDALKPVRVHISTAVKFFADRKAPDYRNSVKESISAVEADTLATLMESGTHCWTSRRSTLTMPNSCWSRALGS
jgi:hypothetical protein